MRDLYLAGRPTASPGSPRAASSGGRKHEVPAGVGFVQGEARSAMQHSCKNELFAVHVSVGKQFFLWCCLVCSYLLKRCVPCHQRAPQRDRVLFPALLGVGAFACWKSLVGS